MYKFNSLSRSFRNGIVILIAFFAATNALRAQEGNINLHAGNVTAEQVVNAIRAQTVYQISINESRFDKQKTIVLSAPSISVKDALNRLFINTPFTYMMDGKYIIMPIERPKKPLLTGSVTGAITDSATGNPLTGVTVAITGKNNSTKTGADGKFQFRNIEAGTYVFKFTSENSDIPTYKEVQVQHDKTNSVDVVIKSLERSNHAVSVSDAAEVVSPTEAAERRLLAMQQIANPSANDSKNTYIIVEPIRQSGDYQPKIALKTNLLYLATTSPNLAAEFRISPRWTFNIAAGYNPWVLKNEDGGFRHWLVQPEFRYWFCNPFEKHFIGVHGLGGQFQVMNMNIPLLGDYRGKRNEGYGIGAGISYGYHLPVSSRWALEFSLGAGYVWLNYDKYSCGECDSYRKNKSKGYFTPTKAAVSLVFMIK